MNTLECIKARKSTKSFTDKKLSDEDILTIASSGIYAPSGMNRQSWHFTIVDDSEWLSNMNARVCEISGRDCCNYNAPVLIIVSADPAHNTSEADCACAIENIYLSATALGVGACWINQLGKGNCESLRDILTDAGVPSSDMVYGCVAIGYAPSDYDRKCKTIKDGAIIWKNHKI